MKKKALGFTLIELMIVVAIIAILIAIALPIYSDYLQKTAVGAVNAEVSSLKTPFDVCVNDGKLTTDTCDLGATGSKYQVPGSGNTVAGGPPAKGGSPTMVINSDGSGTITATLGGSAPAPLSAVGATVAYARDKAGNWDCQTTNIPVKFVPTGCKSAGP